MGICQSTNSKKNKNNSDNTNNNIYINTNKKTIININDGMFGQIVDKTFNEADTNKSGFIEYNEFKEFIAKIHKKLNRPEPTDKDMKEYLKEYDTDKDGKISKQEFVKVVQFMINAERANLKK